MKKQKQQINHAVDVLQNGGVIAYPTEAVFGLGCDPKNLSAVKVILELKQRKKEKGLILVASSIEQLKDYIQPLEKNIEEKRFSPIQENLSAMKEFVLKSQTLFGLPFLLCPLNAKYLTLRH